MESVFSILSTAIVLLFVLDPFGNIAILLPILEGMDNRRRYRIIIREVLIGLIILLFFLFFGDDFLKIFHFKTGSVTIAGGIIFFIIGIRMIFPDPSKSNVFSDGSEPFIVPIAMPMIAGPAALASLILLSHSYPTQRNGLLISLLVAWSISTLIFLAAPMLYRILKKRGLKAMERLMGMLLLIMSIQMVTDGIKDVFQLI